MSNKDYKIDASMFEMTQSDATIHDQKFETKPVGYFKDAWRRFKRNKGSVVAACIILLLVLFAIIAPFVSKYELSDRDKFYINKPPFWRESAEKTALWGGTQTKEVNETMYYYLRAIGVETGLDPIVEVISESVQKVGAKETRYYKVKINTYYQLGVLNTITVTSEDYAKICEYQNATGRQVIYPYVEDKDLAGDSAPNPDTIKGLTSTPEAGGNYWYKVKNLKGLPEFDSNGNFKPAYAMQKNGTLYSEYNSIRVASDPYDASVPNSGYAYAKKNQSGYDCRINYWEYYIYKNGHEPMYLFGTNEYGQDIFNAIGMGARFSLLLAVCVAFVNMLIGTIYGSIEGYYGGATDMILERVSDILSGIPTMIVVTLFNVHIADKVGVVPAFIIAFVATGWIGTASLVRKQFYRFKNREYVLAARTLGASDARIMFRHIYPNSLGTIVTSSVLVIPGVIGSETMLTYLGIVNLASSNTTTIGTLMEQGNRCVTSAPHVLLFPALFLALLMISFNLFGNGLRDAFNPSLRGSEG